MSFLDDRKALTREKRLSALSHFHGTLEGLIDETSGSEIRQRVRTFSQIHEDEIIYAYNVLSSIEDATIVINGSIGCGSLGIAGGSDGSDWYSTNLVERDTILGGDEKLREAVLRAYEERHLKAIFIIGTPVVAINNDDINSVILELEDEVNVPIISIYTDGFKSKTPVTGYDIVTHSLLKYIVENSQGKEKADVVNVISFSESIEDVAQIIKIFDDLDINCQILPKFSSIAEIRLASRAKATVVLNPEEGDYLAKELEEVFNVPYISSEAPIGFRGTKNFVLKLAKALGKEDAALEYIDSAESAISANITNDLLEGKKLFIDASLSRINAYARLFTNLGAEIAGFSVPFVDLDNRKVLGKLNYISKGVTAIVGNGQLFEKANALSKTGTDIYFTENYGAGFASDEGVSVVSAKNLGTYGFDGVLNMYASLKKAIGYTNGLQDEKNSNYKTGWKSKSGNWYVKQEVS